MQRWSTSCGRTALLAVRNRCSSGWPSTVSVRNGRVKNVAGDSSSSTSTSLLEGEELDTGVGRPVEAADQAKDDVDVDVDVDVSVDVTSSYH